MTSAFVLVTHLLLLNSVAAYRINAKGALAESGSGADLKAEDHVQVEANATREKWTSNAECSAVISGAKARSYTWLSSLQCECPYGWVVSGSNNACDAHRGGKYFPTELGYAGANACTCEYAGEPKDFVAIDHMTTNARKECGTEFGFEGNEAHAKLGLPDFLANAHEWCNSNLVPADKRVPERFRGLYWMKDLTLSDVAFCPSLGEYDNATKTIRLSVWNMFVFGKQPNEEVAKLAEEATAFLKVGGPLVYSIVFTNRSFTAANIYTSNSMLNTLINFPMYEIDETPDRTVKKVKDGDIFARPSSIAGFSQATYYAVRIMEDDGSPNLERYNLMKEQENPKGTTIVRYRSIC